jgi:hypothetical protein
MTESIIRIANEVFLVEANKKWLEGDPDHVEKFVKSRHDNWGDGEYTDVSQKKFYKVKITRGHA